MIVENHSGPQLLYPHEPITNSMLSPTVGLSLMDAAFDVTAVRKILACELRAHDYRS